MKERRSVLTSGNTVVHDNVGHGVLGEGQILVLAGEAGHIVVLNEGTEGKSVVAAVNGLGADLAEALEITAVESSVQGVEVEVVGHAGEEVLGLVLVAAHVLSDTGQDLTKSEDAGSLDELGQELIVDVLGGIDTETVDGVGRNEILDPLGEEGDNVGRLGLDIGEGDAIRIEPAVLVVGGVLPLGNVAVRVEVLFVVEGLELGVVDLGGNDVVELLRHVVYDDVDHEEHVTLVKLVNEVLEVLLGAELGVDRGEILRPVTVIRLADGGVFLHVLDDGADLDGIEAHTCTYSVGFWASQEIDGLSGQTYLGCNPTCW